VTSEVNKMRARRRVTGRPHGYHCREVIAWTIIHNQPPQNLHLAPHEVEGDRLVGFLVHAFQKLSVDGRTTGLVKREPKPATRPSSIR